jgi:hypothetical protein
MQARDVIIFAALVAAFALLATAHVTIAVGLLRRRPRWRSAIALIVAPLALYWAVRERMTARSVAWSLGAASYVVLRALSTR